MQIMLRCIQLANLIFLTVSERAAILEIVTQKSALSTKALRTVLKYTQWRAIQIALLTVCEVN